VHEVDASVSENVFTGHDIQVPSAELLNVPGAQASQVSATEPDT